MTDPLGVSSAFTYDADGNQTGSTLPNSVTGVTSFDHAGQPTQIGYSVGGANAATFAYGLNANGQVTSETDSGSATTGATSPTTTNYTYNTASQVTNTSSNMTAPTSGSFTYGASDQLTASTNTAQAAYSATSALCWTLPSGAATISSPSCASAPAGATTYGTNAEGQRTSSATPTQVTASTQTGYTWDASGQLTGVTAGSVGPSANTATSYIYNGTGLRMASTLIPASGAGGPAIQDFAYDPTHTVPQLLSDGDFAFIYGPNSVPIEQLPLATGTPTSTPAIATLSNIGTPDTGATTLITDHLGSVRALIGTTGTVAGVEAAFTYDTYGQPHALAGMSLAALTAVAGPIGDTPGGPAANGASALTPLGFDGAYTDGQTGLEYLVHRYYDPTTGTFLSVDPLVGITGDPYGYVSGDPVNGVDPLGLFCLGLCTFTNAEHYVAKHKTGLIQIAAVVAVVGAVVLTGGLTGIMAGLAPVLLGGDFLTVGFGTIAGVGLATTVVGGLGWLGAELLPGPKQDPFAPIGAMGIGTGCSYAV